MRSKLTSRPIHSMWVDGVRSRGATLIEGLGERAPYDVFERGTSDPDDDGWLVDEVRLLFPRGDEDATPASDDAADWRLIRASGPIDSGMFAILDPARALDDPERGWLGIHYEHDVTARWGRPDCGANATDPPAAVGRGMARLRDGAMWIEFELGGDAPYDLAARFEDDRLAEVSFRIDGVRLGSPSH